MAVEDVNLLVNDANIHHSRKESSDFMQNKNHIFYKGPQNRRHMQIEKSAHKELSFVLGIHTKKMMFDVKQLKT